MSRNEPDNFGRPPFKDWHQSHQDIALGTLSDTADFGDLLVNAMQGIGTIEALKSLGKEKLSGKIMLDIANPLIFHRAFHLH